MKEESHASIPGANLCSISSPSCAAPTHSGSKKTKTQLMQASCGMAVRHSPIIDPNFPKPIYKKSKAR